MKKTAIILLIILMPILITLINFKILAFNENYYKEQFEKNKVYEELTKEETDEAAGELISYLNEGGELKTNYFNEKEKQHLKDVRDIIRRLNILLWSGLAIAAFITTVLLKKRNIKTLGLGLALGGLITIALITILGIMLINFQETFIKFHVLFFDNNLWLLDPATDKLIVMFPENFFYEITEKIAIRSAYSSLGLIAIGIITYTYGKKSEKHKKEK